MEVQLLALLLLFFDSQKKKERHPSFLPFPLFDFAQQLPCDLSALPCLSLFNLRRRKGGGGAGHIPAARVEGKKEKSPSQHLRVFLCWDEKLAAAMTSAADNRWRAERFHLFWSCNGGWRALEPPTLFQWP